jgi:predicted transcriptional regulator
MSSNTTVSLFNKVNRTQIQGDLNISSVRLSQTTKSLKEKGLIVKNGKRGEYVLNKRLKEFVDYMNSMFKERGSLDIEFNFNFMVKWLEK